VSPAKSYSGSISKYICQEGKERKIEMYPTYLDQTDAVAEEKYVFQAIPKEAEIDPDRDLNTLLANLDPNRPWRERQLAARQLGNLANPQALPAMLHALPTDPFWVVRCALIQALEIIGDAAAIPTLQEVAITDDFEVVQGYAVGAIEKLAA
jgi:HEAT repeat protein